MQNDRVRRINRRVNVLDATSLHRNTVSVKTQGSRAIVVGSSVRCLAWAAKLGSSGVSRLRSNRRILLSSSDPI